MLTDFPKIWTPDEIAKLAQTSVQDVLAEIEAGRLVAFRIGSEPRVTDTAFRSFVAGGCGHSGDKVTDKVGSTALAPALWKPMDVFEFKWPSSDTEMYDSAFETTMALPSGRHSFVVGYTKRDVAGMKGRQRVIVFLGKVPRIKPLVEFSGTNDFLQTGLVASVIKDASNKHVRSQTQLPPDYSGFPTVVYSDVVVGPYAAHSIAVVAENDDRDLMLRHAIIRARFKGMISA